MNIQRHSTLHRALPIALLAVLFVVAHASTRNAVARQRQQPAKATNSVASTPSPAPTQSPSAPDATATPAATPTASQHQANTGGDEQILINTDLISLTVTVTDNYGRYVSGLNKSAFSVFDDKAEQDVMFFSDEDAPVSVGVIFDVSGSMSGDKIQHSREALRRFVETSHESDEYFLIGFNSRAQLLLDRTRNSEAVLDKLTFVQTKGQTALYDACYLGVEKVGRGTHPKRALLVISDGQDNSSRYTFSNLRRLLKESDVTVYSIGILGGSDAGSTFGVEGQAILTELSAVSGGKAFFPNTSAELDDVFERIALELRHQYSIGYRPSNFANDGKYHHIKVKVAPPRGLPRLFVRSKDGYYAVTNPR